jgi:hypothetical protein
LKAKASEAALVLAAFSCLTLIATFPLVLHLGRALPGDLGDPLFSSWLLAWDAERLRHGLHAFWDAPILFPSRHTVAFSEHLLGIALPIAPIIWLTGNPILGYDVAFLLTYVIAGSGMYLLARELTGRRDAAFLAGLMFAFSPVRALHVSHIQVLAWGWIPIALWGLHRSIAALKASDGTRRSTYALGVFVAAFIVQAMSNGYFFYYLTIASAFVVAGELASRSTSAAARWRILRALSVAAFVILVAIAFVAVAYLSVRRQYGFVRPYDDWKTYSANVRSYLSAPATVRLWSTWLRGDDFPERQLFPGLIVLVGAVAGIWRGPRRLRSATLYGVLAAAAFLLSLGPEPAAWSYRLLPSGPYGWLARVVPGMDGLRVPARLGVLVLLSLVVLAALGFARVLARLQPRVRLVLVVLIGIAIFAEGWAVPLRMAPVEARGRPSDRSAYRWLAQQPEGAAIELPILEWSIDPTLTYQFATLMHGHPIVNGYSGYGSALQEFLGGAASPLNDVDAMADALALLRGVGVRYVLVHAGDYADSNLGAETVAAIRAQKGIASEQFRSDSVVGFQLATGERPVDTDVMENSHRHRLRPSDFRAEASDATDRLPLTFDDDGDTRWLTGRPQRGDEWIRVAFDRIRDVSAISLQTAPRSFGDYPRALRIESAGDNGERSVLYESAMLVPYGRMLALGRPHPALVISLPPNRTRTLTIAQTGQTRRWFWSIHELGIFER